MGELYGEVNKLTLEWNDGLMAITVRHCVKVQYMSAASLHKLILICQVLTQSHIHVHVLYMYMYTIIIIIINISF